MLQPESLRVGIIGASVHNTGVGWAALAHVPAVQAAHGLELSAVGTSNAESAASSAAVFGAARGHADPRALIADPDVDLVAVVLSPRHDHDIALAALAADKPLFVEWPVGLSVDGAEELARVAKERGIPSAVGFQARNRPAFVRARELLATGAVGDVRSARVHLRTSGPIDRHDWEAVFGDRSRGMTNLAISGGHFLDIVRFLLGEFAEVAARTTTQVREWRIIETGETIVPDIPDFVAFVAGLTTGVDVVGELSSAPATADSWAIEAEGTEGRLSLTADRWEDEPRLTISRPGGESEAVVVPDDAGLHFDAGFVREVGLTYERFRDSIQSGVPFDADLAAAARMHRLLAAFEQSSRERRTVTLG